MSDLTRKTAADLAAALAAREVSSAEVTQAHLDAIEATDSQINAYLHVNTDEALEAAKSVDERRRDGDSLPELAGVPVALKDSIVTKGQATTAASKMLENWVPPYDATVVARLRAAGLPILGKTNLDEFAMGSSTEFSAFGPTRTPWDPERTPGGSGGGSSATLAAFTAPPALGSGSGGSIREPAALTGTVGVKPTYGGVSRYGLIALASSLDQVGPAARTVLDAALLHDVIGGHDVRDSTSLPEELPSNAEAARAGAQRDLHGTKVGIIKQLAGPGYGPGVNETFQANLDLLTEAGAEIVEIDCPSFDAALGAYYIIMSAEASSNLARLDGMRYGLRVSPSEGPVTAERVMAATRGAGFGPEVKRRIMLGTYVLSAGFYDAYYGNAQRVRTLVQRDFADAFASVDVLVSPTAATTAFKLGERVDDPLAMYRGDFATIPVNLAGLPALSLPGGVAEGLPVGLQVIAPAREDARMYSFAAAIEARINAGGGPILESAPDLKEAK